jgi:hypothetical protein
VRSIVFQFLYRVAIAIAMIGWTWTIVGGLARVL